jgi:cell division septation protein DedD
MEIQLKQRLLGVIVIFTLLIIFLPMFFQNNSDQDYVEQILEPPIPQGIKDKKIIIDKDEKNSDDELIEKQLLEVLPSTVEAKQAENQIENPIIVDAVEGLDTDSDDLALQAKSEIKNNSTELDNTDSESVEKKSNTVNTNDNTNTIVLEQSNITENNPKTRVIYKVGNEITKDQVFAIKIDSFNNSINAHKEKSKLLAIGLPAYINKNKEQYELFVGPELEFQYIKELVKRIENETNYNAEVLAHDSRWVTE